MPNININVLIYNIDKFKQDLVAYANKIKLNEDDDWKLDDAIVTLSDGGMMNFWIHSRMYESDFFHVVMNMKHFQDDRVVEHQLAECKAKMDEQKQNE